MLTTRKSLAASTGVKLKAERQIHFGVWLIGTIIGCRISFIFCTIERQDKICTLWTLRSESLNFGLGVRTAGMCSCNRMCRKVQGCSKEFVPDVRPVIITVD